MSALITTSSHCARAVKTLALGLLLLAFGAGATADMLGARPKDAARCEAREARRMVLEDHDPATRRAIRREYKRMGRHDGDFEKAIKRITKRADQQFAAMERDAFGGSVYPLLETNCTACHSGGGPGSPDIAHESVGRAHRAVVDNDKVDLADPANSRLVLRLTVDGHHCWGDCAQNGAEMTAAISTWGTAIAGLEVAPPAAPAPLSKKRAKRKAALADFDCEEKLAIRREFKRLGSDKSDWKRAVKRVAKSVDAGDTGGGDTGGGGVDDGGGGGGGGGNDDDDGGAIDPGPAAFAETTFPILREYCVACHAGAGPGSPHIANADTATAYSAVVDNQKVNLFTPINSRLVQRLVSDFHHCWGDCAENGEEMRSAIADWSMRVDLDDGGVVVEDRLASAGATLADGVEDAGNRRFMQDVIAFYEFKEGSGDVARDTSGVSPAVDLSLSGTEWLAGQGIEIVSGKATATPAASRKLFDEIASPATGTNEYSIEAWVIPGNVTQEGPARIVSYSSGTGDRNFTLGQVQYSYDFRNRSGAGGIGQNGTPSLRTNDDDEDLQATLQHVVVTFDQTNGRLIYVNGMPTGDSDDNGPGGLANWNANYTFLLGNETTDNRLWLGKIQLVSIFKRALTPNQVMQNYQAGVGQKFSLRFGLAEWVGPDAYLEFEVSEFDNFSYLFCAPTFVGSDAAGLRLANLRIAVNGQVPVSGQAFTQIDELVATSGQELSRQCTVVPKDRGTDLDEFSIVFEQIGDLSDPVADLPPSAPPVFDQAELLPDEGVRDFDQINNTMSRLTGVDPNSGNVRRTFLELKQQLPSGFDVRSFVSAHQVGISKLALEYCDSLVESRSLRENFFGVDPAFEFDAPVPTSFSNQAKKDLVIDRLVDGMLGTGLEDQPDRSEARPVLDGLIDDLTNGCNAATCDATRTRSVVKGACAAVLGSAGVLVY